MGIGLIRTLLAMSIVIAHTSSVFGYNIVNAIMAIQIFYMISGFYMALILNEKYDTFLLFITNRFLRLYPMYIVVFVLTILLAFLSLQLYGSWGRLTYYKEYYHVLHPLTLFLLLLTNLIIFGQDVISFLGLNKNSGLLYFTENFNSSHPPVYEFLIVPQAWTLGVELIFYMLAPFIVRRNTYFIVLLLAISYTVRFILLRAGLPYDPWGHRFFPSALTFFLMGTLSYKLYKKIAWTKVSKGLLKGFTLVIIILTLTFQFIPIDYVKKEVVYYLLFASLLPFAFSCGKNSRFDRRIGDLSYPIYISHIFIIAVFSSMNIFRFMDQINKSYYAIIVALATSTFSVLLLRFIQDPVDHYRAIRVEDRNRNRQAEIHNTNSEEYPPIPRQD